MNDFNNTYINTDSLSGEDLTRLYRKYGEISFIKSKKFLYGHKFLYIKDGVLGYTDDHHVIINLKEIMENDLYMYEEYTYEVVKDMSVGQMVDHLFTNRQRFYYEGLPISFTESSVKVKCMDQCALMDLTFLKTQLDKGCIFRRVEKPWWDKHKGTLVAVRHKIYEEWSYDIFEEYNKSADQFKCKSNSWKCMRPLTKVEKDSIITQDV